LNWEYIAGEKKCKGVSWGRRKLSKEAVQTVSALRDGEGRLKEERKREKG